MQSIGVIIQQKKKLNPSSSNSPNASSRPILEYHYGIDLNLYIINPNEKLLIPALGRVYYTPSHHQFKFVQSVVKMIDIWMDSLSIFDVFPVKKDLEFYHSRINGPKDIKKVLSTHYWTYQIPLPYNLSCYSHFLKIVICFFVFGGLFVLFRKKFNRG